MKTMTFEEALQELEAIVRKLEEGHMPLNESVKAYERGIYLRKFCDQQLESAQLKIEEVIVTNDKISTKPFDVESSSSQKTQQEPPKMPITAES